MINDAENKKSKIEHYEAVVNGPNGQWAQKPTLPPRCLDSVYLDTGLKKQLVSDITQYVSKDSQTYYSDRGIPHRRGYLLYGRPGCGKTSFAKAIASKFKLKLYTLSLRTPGLTDALLLDLFGKLSKGSLLLLEDVDCAGLARDQGQPAELNESTAPGRDPKIPRSTSKEKQNQSAASTSDDDSMAFHKTLLEMMKANPNQ